MYGATLSQFIIDFMQARAPRLRIFSSTIEYYFFDVMINR